MRWIRPLKSVTSAEWRLLRIALPLVVAIRLALWLLPSRVLIAHARSIAARPPLRDPGAAEPSLIAWAVTASARRVPRASCLTQALAAQLLLLRHGHRAELCVGVARDASGGFRAHAWIECGGRILVGGDTSAAFTRLHAFGGTGSASPAGATS